MSDKPLTVRMRELRDEVVWPHDDDFQTWTVQIEETKTLLEALAATKTAVFDWRTGMIGATEAMNAIRAELEQRGIYTASRKEQL